MIIDRTAFLVCRKRFENLNFDEQHEFELLPPDIVDEVNSEIDELVKNGVLGVPESKIELARNGEIKAMCLHICHDCNLKCSYCFAKEGTYNTERDYMSAEVGRKALDFLLEKSGNRHNLEVDFFGGEPLMNLSVVKEIVAYGRELCQKAGKHISFTMTTNGVLLTHEVQQYLNDEMDNVVISIDGRKEIHDKLRITRGGKGSYDTALRHAKEFRAIRGDKRYYIRGTFTANNKDFDKDVLALADAGFDQISLEPVVLGEDEPLALHNSDLPEIFAGYERLACEYIDRRADGRWFNFFHFMLDLEHGPCAVKRLTGCGAGAEYVAVSPTGDIFPCHQFVGGNPEYKMGSVLTGEFNRDIQKTFQNVVVYNKPDCAACAAKYYCSGGCAANSLHYGGALTACHSLSCEMMRKRFFLSLAINALEHGTDVKQSRY